ncbi:MAG: hypothetical protein AB1796_03685 [Bacillota bacterium]
MDEKKDLTAQAMSKQSRNIQARARQKPRGKWLKAFLLAVLIIIGWAGIIYGGYYYATKHLQETEQFFAGQIEELLLANARIEEKITGTMQSFYLELEQTNAEIVQIRGELQMIQEELALTGETITGSDKTRQSLQERITELDKQLTSLKEQLKKLEDAVRAF